MLDCCARHKHKETRERNRKILHLPPQKEDQIQADFYATEEITQKIEPGPKTQPEQIILSLQQRSIRQ